MEGSEPGSNGPRAAENPLVPAAKTGGTDLAPRLGANDDLRLPGHDFAAYARAGSRGPADVPARRRSRLAGDLRIRPGIRTGAGGPGGLLGTRPRRKRRSGRGDAAGGGARRRGSRPRRAPGPGSEVRAAGWDGPGRDGRTRCRRRPGRWWKQPAEPAGSAGDRIGRRRTAARPRRAGPDPLPGRRGTRPGRRAWREDHQCGGIPRWYRASAGGAGTADGEARSVPYLSGHGRRARCAHRTQDATERGSGAAPERVPAGPLTDPPPDSLASGRRCRSGSAGLQAPTGRTGQHRGRRPRNSRCHARRLTGPIRGRQNAERTQG